MDEAGNCLIRNCKRGRAPMQQQSGWQLTIRKRRSIRFSTHVLAVIPAAALCVGCNGSQTGTVPTSRQAPTGVTLRVAAPPGRARLLVERLGKAWANDAGAKLEIVNPIGDWPEADVVLMPAADLPRWAAAGKAAVLPRSEAVDAFMPLYRSRLLGWAGTAYALPVLGDAPVCVYRRDLYADPAAKQAYQDKYRRPLKPPETWDEFADQAEFFAARRARPSLPPLPAGDADVCAAFETVAAPYAVAAVTTTAEKPVGAHTARPFSFQYDVDSGQPRIADPGFVEALALLKRMQPHRAATPSAAEAMRSDQVALAAIQLADVAAAGPEEARRWGVFRTPGSSLPLVNGRGLNKNAVPFLGAAAVVGVVPVKSANAAAAFDLLMFLSGPTASTEVVHTPAYGGGPFRDMHADTQHELGWLNYGLDEKETAQLRLILRDVADPRVDNPAIVLRIPGRTSHVAALAAAVRTAVTGGDPAAALRGAADRWRKLDGDPARARADYRRGVGLQP
jgi:multiple sugar transport system substrate-binding protein